MLLGNRTLSDDQQALHVQFANFLEHDRYSDKYNQRIHTMMSDNANRVLIDMSDLLSYEGGKLGRGVVDTPLEHIPIFELALHSLVVKRQPNYLKVDYRSRPVHVGFDGPVGKVLTPRGLCARYLNTMVALEGTITRQSHGRPRVLETVHYCTATNKFSRKEYRDQLTPMIDSAHLPTVNVMPKTDMEGNPLRTELGLSSFIDSQCAMLQESPEDAPTGQLPRSVELRFDDDLVDKVKPGDRVEIVGTYCPFTSSEGSAKTFQKMVLVNHIHHFSRSARVPQILDTHKAEIEAFAALHGAATNTRSGILDILSRSIAPAIYGLTPQKKAVLLMAIGGVERVAHHSHIRGDINVLMVGEPSTAKSQLLRYMLGLVPLALSTTGKGSSGVGLTAAVTVDQYSNERSLSAGAMVLADRGVLCIDEFDKMTPADRVAMHEAMEQQTVTITKAGIRASLNARCSVLAAANPVYGNYSPAHTLAWNVGLPESLLSRFDLTFIILDQNSAEHNRRVGSHILKNHQKAQPVPFNSQQSSLRSVVGRDASRGVGGQRTNDELAEGFRATDTSKLPIGADGLPIVPIGFLRQYIQYARSITPLLSEEARLLATQQYVQLRDEQTDTRGGSQTKDGFIITARTLEAIMRLSAAHARLRLSRVISELDVEVAMDLLRCSVQTTTDARTPAPPEVPQTAQAVPSVPHPMFTAVPQHPPHAAPHTGPAADDDDNDASSPSGRPTKAHRTENVSAAADSQPKATQPTAPTPSATSTTDLPARILSALNDFRRKFAAQVHLGELRMKLADLGTDVDLVTLQSVVSAMDEDDFTFTSDGEEDVITFI